MFSNAWYMLPVWWSTPHEYITSNVPSDSRNSLSNADPVLISHCAGLLFFLWRYFAQPIEKSSMSMLSTFLAPRR